MMILHTCIAHDPYWFLGEKVKGQCQMYTLQMASFPHDNSITFWHTMLILHTWVDHDPRRTSIDFLVSSRHIWTLNFVPFPHDNSITFWHTIMFLHTWVDHNPRWTSIDFRVNRSKVKVKFGLSTFQNFWTITLSYLTYTDDTWRICCLLSEEQPYRFCGQRSR